MHLSDAHADALQQAGRIQGRTFKKLPRLDVLARWRDEKEVAQDGYDANE